MSLQSLGISSEASKTDEELMVDPVNLLKVGGDRLQLHAEPPVAGDGEAVLPHHRHQGAPIILKDLQFIQLNKSHTRNGGEPNIGLSTNSNTHRHLDAENDQMPKLFFAILCLCDFEGLEKNMSFFWSAIA